MRFVELMESLEWVEFKEMLTELDAVISQEDAKEWWTKYVPDYKFPDSHIDFLSEAIHILHVKTTQFGLLGEQ